MYRAMITPPLYVPGTDNEGICFIWCNTAMHRRSISHQYLVYSYVREANGKAGYVMRDVHDSPTEIDPGVHVLDAGRDLGCANPEENKKKACLRSR